VGRGAAGLEHAGDAEAILAQERTAAERVAGTWDAAAEAALRAQVATG
jgi:hypothetical protein